jgi:hypothetical protein
MINRNETKSICDKFRVFPKSISDALGSRLVFLCARGAIRKMTFVQRKGYSGQWLGWLVAMVNLVSAKELRHYEG